MSSIAKAGNIQNANWMQAIIVMSNLTLIVLLIFVSLMVSRFHSVQFLILKRELSFKGLLILQSLNKRFLINYI